MGIANNGISWRTRREMPLTRSKECEFEDNIDAAQSRESPEVGKTLGQHGHGISLSAGNDASGPSTADSGVEKG
jgi:hypothetical protein